MRLPNCTEAIVPNRKLTGYLLDHAHPQNKGKAAFYEIVGFTKENPDDLRMALLSHVLANEVAKIINTDLAFGMLLKAGCNVQMANNIQFGQYGLLQTARKFLN